MNHIFFDLDGTITNPAQGITNSVKHALRFYGIEEKTENLLRFIGPPLVESFQEFYGFRLKQANEAVVKYREYFSVKGLYENEVYEGMEAFLEDLKEQGYHLHIATSKPEVYSKKIIEYFHLDTYFDNVFGASLDSSRAKKGQVIQYGLETLGLSGEEVLMVGDRLHDIEGAHQNQMKAIGVLYGFGSREELEKYHAEVVVASLQELTTAIETMCG